MEGLEGELEEERTALARVEGKVAKLQEHNALLKEYLLGREEEIKAVWQTYEQQH